MLANCDQCDELATLHCHDRWHDSRALTADRRNPQVGLDVRRADGKRGAHRLARRFGAIEGRAQARRSTARSPTGCSRARRRDSRACFHRVETRDEVRALRLGDVILERTARSSGKSFAKQPGDERADVGPLPDGVARAAPCRRAAPARRRSPPRGADAARRTTSPRAPEAGRCPADGAARASTNPP